MGVYCRNNIIFYAVNIARLDNPTATLLSWWRRRPIRHFHPGSRFFHFNSQYSTMRGDFRGITQLIWNRATDIIILFPFFFRQSSPYFIGRSNLDPGYSLGETFPWKRKYIGRKSTKIWSLYVIESSIWNLHQLMDRTYALKGWERNRKQKKVDFGRWNRLW